MNFVDIGAVIVNDYEYLSHVQSPFLSTYIYMSAVNCNSAFFFRVMNSTAISAVSSVLEENGRAGFHFVIVNIDGTDVFGSVLFQYVVPRLTSVPENRIIQAYV